MSQLRSLQAREEPSLLLVQQAEEQDDPSLQLVREKRGLQPRTNLASRLAFAALKLLSSSLTSVHGHVNKRAPKLATDNPPSSNELKQRVFNLYLKHNLQLRCSVSCI